MTWIPGSHHHHWTLATKEARKPACVGSWGKCFIFNIKSVESWQQIAISSCKIYILLLILFAQLCSIPDRFLKNECSQSPPKIEQTNQFIIKQKIHQTSFESKTRTTKAMKHYHPCCYFCSFFPFNRHSLSFPPGEVAIFLTWQGSPCRRRGNQMGCR